ncbi:hypothetical protein HR060_06155 [Catenovulum sp. SM1970]|uniref:hypothetical protein n=1 Tax=Marinifaba aquimaris TaxID=2741323 RepID=UPI00157212DE|nr:hypothetical protein [Marinifaba aquimaris]NTS76448.1 hypothetical protein [Marinifaba aquimaris]
MSTRANLAKFDQAKVDGVITGKIQAQYLTLLERYDVLEVNRKKYYCALSLAMPSALKTKIQASIDKLNKANHFEKLLTKYIKH